MQLTIFKQRRSILTLVYFVVVLLFIIPNYSYSQTLSNCNNWAQILQRNTNCIDCGNISISRNKLTVEALINKSDAFDDTNVGDIISKHNDPTGCNYLLRLIGANITNTYEITATNFCKEFHKKGTLVLIK